MPASALRTRMLPLEEARPAPALNEMLPPVALVASPAICTTWPPATPDPCALPTTIDTLPPAPSRASPVRISMPPEAPCVDFPVEKDMCPDTPAIPASRVCTETAPLDVALPTPLRKLSIPPVPVLPIPASTTTCPPRAFLPELFASPAVTYTDPPDVSAPVVAPAIRRISPPFSYPLALSLSPTVSAMSPPLPWRACPVLIETDPDAPRVAAPVSNWSAPDTPPNVPAPRDRTMTLPEDLPVDAPLVRLTVPPVPLLASVRYPAGIPSSGTAHVSTHPVSWTMRPASVPPSHGKTTGVPTKSGAHSKPEIAPVEAKDLRVKSPDTAFGSGRT